MQTKNVGTQKTECFIHKQYVVIQRTAQNKYDVLNSSYLSGIDWSTAHRYTGTKNQVKKYLESKN